MKATQHFLDYQEDGTVIVLGECPVSGEEWTLTVDAEAYDRWVNREILIQDAFPTLSRAEREQLMTGYTKKGWDMMFDPDPSEED